MPASKNIDIRSLRFFIDLLQTGSLVETGDNFAMSAATAQRTLAKLRLCFDDPLFVRQGFSMMPTMKARTIASEIRSMLAVFDHAGMGADAFEKRDYRLRMTAFDNAAIAVLSRIFLPVRSRAPKLRFQILQADERMFEQLRAGDIDFAVYARQGVPSDCLSTPLVTTPYVWVVRKGHALEKEVAKTGFVAREQAVRFPQVIANAQPDRRREPNGPAEGWFAQGAKPPIAAMPFFLAAPFFLDETSVTLVPEITARTVFDPARFSLLATEPNSPKLTMRLAWTAERDRDLFHQWLRALLTSAAQNLIAGTEKNDDQRKPPFS